MARLSHQTPTAPSMSPHRKTPSLSSQRATSPLPPLQTRHLSDGSGVIAIGISDIHKSSFVAGILTSLVIYILVQQWYLALFENNGGAITFLLLGASIISWGVGRQQGRKAQKKATQELSAASISITPAFDSAKTLLGDDEQRRSRSPEKLSSPIRSSTLAREPAHNDGDAHQATGRNLLNDQHFQPHLLPSSPSPPPSPGFETAVATEKARQKNEEARRQEHERQRERARREKEKERKARKEAKLRHERERKEREERELEAERKALEKIEREKKESEQREREAMEKEAAEKEKKIRERLEKQAKELKERAARERIARAKLEMEAREREIREKAEREAREKAEQELRERLEKETKEKIEREMKEREAKEKAEKQTGVANDKDSERSQEVRRKMEEYKRRKEKEEQERKAKMDKEAREQEFRERRERREREKAEREAFQLATEREAAEKAAKEKAREEAVAKFAAARDALAAKRAAAIAAGARGISPSLDGRLSPSAFGLSSFGYNSPSPSNGSELGLAPPNSPRKTSIRAVSAPRSPELGGVKPTNIPEPSSAEPLSLEKPADAEEKGKSVPVNSSTEQDSREGEQRADDALTVNETEAIASSSSPPRPLPLIKVELFKEEVAAAEAAVEVAGKELEQAEASIHEVDENDHVFKGRSDSRGECAYSVGESYTRDEADEEGTVDEYGPESPRHEDHQRLTPDIPHLAPPMTPESLFSESFISGDTDLSDPLHGNSPPASNITATKPYSTLDPDKIVIEGVYLFNTNISETPISKLESGRGNVTDGLILRITTEGMFIDDDIRGVAERDWDVKAWTMSLVEVWCPVLRGRLPNVNHATRARPASSDKSHPPRSFNIFRRSTPSVSSSPTRSSVTDEESANCLLQLFKTCRETCYGLRTDNTGSALGDYHVIKTTVRDIEGKSFVFVLRNEEAWK
ncbi:hypothetical protein KEM56_002407, partial [Ascosphaera pollenicola]